MPRSLTVAGSSGPEHGLVDRVRELRDRIWRGNMALMARDLGVNKATLGRVLKDGQTPATALLLALAARGDVDAHWLLTGAPARPPWRATIPFARTLLPGPPAVHPTLLSAASLTLDDYPDAEPGEVYA